MKHTVQSKEVLSKIVYKYFSGTKLYGRDGKVQEVLLLNPNVKNKNFIYPGQVILLSGNEEEASTPTVSSEERVSIPDVASESAEAVDTKRFPMSVRALAGAKFVSLNQQGILGTGNINSVFLNYYNIGISTFFGEWMARFDYETYRADYQVGNSSESLSFDSFELGAEHDWYSFAAGVEQAPILSAQITPVLNKHGLLYAGVGIQHEYGVQVLQKPSTAGLKFQVRYPLKSFGESSGMRVSNLSGYHLVGQVDARMQLFKRDNYKLFINWLNTVEYQSLSRDISWNSTSGKVDSQSFNVTTALGLSLDF